MRSNKNVTPKSQIPRGRRKRECHKKDDSQFQGPGVCLVKEAGIRACQRNEDDIRIPSGDI